MTALRSLLPVLLTLIGCGGKIATSDEPPPSTREDTENSSTSSAMPWAVTTPPSQPAAIPEDGEWGTWQLLSVDQPDGGRDYKPTYVEMDLHPSGEAYLWHCSTQPTGTGQRCPYEARVGCVVGTIYVVGMDWFVEFPRSRALVEDEPSGDIFVDGVGVIPSGGHYRRVAAPSFDRCAP